MLLRSITKHVKDQNWFAVALDFFIVVAGILIAFQITEWNEGRADRQREIQILQDIASDLQTDIDGYSVAINSTWNKIAAIKFILDNTTVAPGKNLADGFEINGVSFSEILTENEQSGVMSLQKRAESFDEELWSYAILVSNAQPSTTAIDSLVSSGEFGLLQDQSLVQRLQQYRFLTASLVKAQEVTFRPRRDRAIDIGLDFGLSPFRGVEKAKLLEFVSANPKLGAVIQSQIGWGTGHLIMLNSAHDSAVEVLKQIESDPRTRSAMEDTNPAR